MAMNGRVVPPAGWLPDPSRSDYERYWDGKTWTARVRDKATGEEWSPRGSRRARRGSRRRTAMWTVVGALVIALVGVAGWWSVLPTWVPWPEALEKPAPTGPEVAYPVFGSDDLVTYLARSMVAQEEEIDLSWIAFTEAEAGEVIPDAIEEAVYQNPYVFVDGWEWRIQYPEAVLIPSYTYDAVEADRRRQETAIAVEMLAADGAIASASTPRELAIAAHDVVVAAVAYDDAASDEVLDGASTATSERVARSQEAYGALVEGSAVCTGYAQSYLLLARLLGLDAVIVTGEADGGETTGLHAWNLVELDGEWLVVDTTWDDLGPFGTQSAYLLLPQDSDLMSTRAADASWMTDSRLESFAS